MPSNIPFEDPGGVRYESEAYLAEFLSWGGHSGSPVYFLEPQTLITLFTAEDGEDTGYGRTDFAWVSGFLGMVSAHYDINRPSTVTGEVGTVVTALNSGIATVVPADTIRGLLTSAPLVEQRASLKAEMAAKFSTPSLDIGPAATSTATPSIGPGTQPYRVLRSVEVVDNQSP